MPVTSGVVLGANAEFNMKKQHGKLYTEAFLDDPLQQVIIKLGIGKTHDKLTETGGTSVNLYNVIRHDSKGKSGDADQYATAKQLQYGYRNINIGRLSDSLTYPRYGSLAQQQAAFNLGDEVSSHITKWFKCYRRAQIINQIFGNTATSFLVPDLSQTPFATVDERLQVNGFNNPVAPDPSYKGYGSLAALGGDENVTSAHPLTLKDIHAEKIRMDTLTAGSIVANPIMGEKFRYVLIVSENGMRQLLEDASTNSITLKDLTLATMNGGKGFPDLEMYEIPYMGVAILVLPNHMIPNGVHSGTNAVVPFTKRAAMVGANAIDIAYGRGYAPAGGNPMRGFKITIDDKHMIANEKTYVIVQDLSGVIKTRLEGQDGVYHDNAVGIITHYSAT